MDHAVKNTQKDGVISVYLFKMESNIKVELPQNKRAGRYIDRE